MRVSRAHAGLMLVLGLASCHAPYHITRLPTFEFVAEHTSSPTRPTLVEGDSVDTSGFPVLVPFAVVSTFHGSRAKETTIRGLWHRGASLGAEVVWITYGKSVYAGSSGTSAHLGFGVSTAFSTPMYEHAIYGYCYKAATARVGFSCDESNMIISVQDKTRSASGIQEGDKIVSLNGAPVTWSRDRRMTSPHLHQLLKLKPGDKVKLVWIRPGKGRMESTTEALPNPTDALSRAKPPIPWKPYIQVGF